MLKESGRGAEAPQDAADGRGRIAGSLRDAAILQEVDGYCESLEKGQKPDRRALLDRHPEIASELAACLNAMEFVRLAGWDGGESGSGQRGSRPEDLQPLATLGDFRLVRELGRGGMGVVYEAEQISLGRRVALKMLPLGGALDQRQLHRFQNEARCAAALDHPNVVSVYAVGCHRGVHYYAMQYIEGRTLAQVIAELRSGEQGAGSRKPERSDAADSTREAFLEAEISAKSGLVQRQGEGAWDVEFSVNSETLDSEFVHALPPRPKPGSPSSTVGPARSRQYYRRVAELGMQAADAMEHAHQLGIVHRDIKPSNLMLDVRGHLWVTDFGLALVETDADLTMTGDVLGTLRYMSPEQARGDRAVLDSRTDIYSLGATLYELLTLRPAFAQKDRVTLLHGVLSEEPPQPRQLHANIPADLETIALKAMAKEPGERYPTAAALAEDLRNFLEYRPIRATRPTLWQQAAKWSRRRSGVVAAAAAVFAVATITLSLSVAYVSRANHQVRQALEVANRSYRQAEENARAAEENARQAREQRRLANRQAELSRHFLYASDMRLAGKAWATGDAAQMAELLQRHVPRAGETDLRGFEWHYLSDCNTAPHVHLAAGSEAVYFACYSPAGDRIATAGKDGVVRLYDASTLREIQAIPAGQGEINGLAFVPTGGELVSAGDDGTLRFWELPGGKARLTIPAFEKPAYQVAFTPDGTLLASCGDDAVIRLWNPATGEAAGTLEGHVKAVEAIAISPKGARLGSAGRDGFIKLWDLEKRQLICSHGDYNPFTSVAFSWDGRRMAAGAVAGDVFVFDGVSGAGVSHHVRRDGVQSVAFSPDGYHLLAGDRSGAIKLWPLLEHENSAPFDARALTGRETWQAHAGRVYALAVPPNREQILSAGGDGKVAVWTTARSTMRAMDQTAEFTTQVLAFEPVSGSLVVAGLDGVCRCDGSAEDRSVLIPPTDGHWTSIDISPQGVLAAGSGNGKIVLFDPARRSVLTEWELPEAGRIQFLRFSAGGTRLAAVGWEQRQRVEWFDVAASKKLPATIMGGDVDGMARSPDGRTILLSVDNDLFVLDPRTRRVARRLAGHATTLSSIASSPVASLVATVGKDRRLILHDMAAGRQVFSSVAGMDDLHTACFSPDGRTLATGGINGSVELWHVSTRQPLFELPLGDVEELVFSPDGRRLAVRLAGGRVFLSGLDGLLH